MLAGALALGACGVLPNLDLFASPPLSPAPGDARAGLVPAVVPATEAGTAADQADAPPADGRYAGLAILTAFHGDCNAGGTGQIVVHGRTLAYRDDRNPALSGTLGEHGSVDLASGSTRLSGQFAVGVFTGRIAGGACEYQMRFERMPG